MLAHSGKDSFIMLLYLHDNNAAQARSFLRRLQPLVGKVVLYPL